METVSRQAPSARAVADRLHSAAIHLLRRLRSEDAASGLTAPRLSALSVLVFGGPRSIGDLAAAEQVRPPTISRLVRELERDGLVTRTVHPVVPPRVEYKLTKRGESLGEAVCEIWLWVEKNMEAVEKSRKAYQRKNATGRTA